MSRNPPRPFLRSGSTRCAISPLRDQRCWAESASSSRRERMLLRRLGELVQPTTNAAAPRAPHRAGHRGEQILVAGDQPGVQQPQRGTQVGRRHLHGLPDGAHAVVELDAGVPQRVPQRSRELSHVALALVHEYQIQVGIRHHLAAAQGTHGNQRSATTDTQ